MKISILGATGRVGQIILENALAEQHTVRALVRDQTKLTIQDANLTILTGDALNESDLANAIVDSDAVISALNTDGANTLSKSMPLIIQQMKAQGVNRIITIGTAGILQARTEPALFRFQSSESKRTSTKDAEDHLKAYICLKDSGLDWTIVCPTYLPTGERTGTFRFEKDFLPENPTAISIYDTADFAFQQLFTSEYIGSRIGLTY